MQHSPVPQPHPAPRLIYTESPMGHRGFLYTACWVQEDRAPDYPVVDSFDAVTDDFGDLCRLPVTDGFIYATSQLYAHSADTHFDIDDASHALIWPEAAAPVVSTTRPCVEASIKQPESLDWVAAEIRVRYAGFDLGLDGTLLYRLCIGHEPPIYASQHELQGLASACAELLGLQLRAKPTLYRRRAKAASRTAA